VPEWIDETVAEKKLPDNRKNIERINAKKRETPMICLYRNAKRRNRTKKVFRL